MNDDTLIGIAALLITAGCVLWVWMYRRRRPRPTLRAPDRACERHAFKDS